MMRSAARGDFAMAVTEIRVLEKGLLTDAALHALLDTRSLKRGEALLRAAGYPDPALTADGYDRMLTRATEHFAAQVALRAPDRPVFDLLYLPYDIYNIKALLMGGLPVIAVPPGRAVRYRILLDGLDEPREDDRFDALFVEAAERFRSEGAKRLQEWLDHRYFRLLLETAKASDSSLCLEYARAQIDFYNLTALLRLRRMGGEETADILAAFDALCAEGGAIPLDELRESLSAPLIDLPARLEDTAYRAFLPAAAEEYRTSRDLSVLEVGMDNYLTALFRAHQFTPLGPEAILGYFYARQLELRNLRLICATLFDGLPHETALGRLRESYG